MPTYDYVCKLCGHELEIIQSMTAGVKRKCPACGERGLQRRIGAGAGLIFKGSGFYETDYRRKGRPDAKSEGEGEGGAKKDADTPAPADAKTADAKKPGAKKPDPDAKAKPDKKDAS
jgi:putative FmdB family regulatory protein